MAFQCEECQKEFGSEEGLNQHKQDKHGLGPTKHEMRETKRLRKEEERDQRKIEIKQSSKSKLIKNISYVAISVLILAAVTYFIIAPAPEIVITAETNVTSIVIEGSLADEYSYTPSQLSIVEGDVVRVTFNNNGRIPHNWVLRGYNIATNTIAPGASDTVQFVADKSGEFEYYCSLRGHRERGMLGLLTVE